MDFSSITLVAPFIFVKIIQIHYHIHTFLFLLIVWGLHFYFLILSYFYDSQSSYLLYKLISFLNLRKMKSEALASITELCYPDWIYYPRYLEHIFFNPKTINQK